MEILDRLIANSVEKPKAVALTFVDERLRQKDYTYDDVLNKSRSIASHLGRQPGNPKAILLFPTGDPNFIFTFLGCLLAGVLPTALPLNRQQRFFKLISNVSRELENVLFLTRSKDKNHPYIAALAEDRSKRIIAVDELNGNPKSVPLKSSAGNIAYLQYTSGSTTTPRGVVVKHSSLIENIQAIRENFGANPESVIVSWLPHYHDMGLISGSLLPLAIGFRTIQFSSALFSRQPLLWPRMIQRYSASISGGPISAYRAITRRAVSREDIPDLSSLKIAFCGAEPISARVAEDFVDKFSEAGLKENVFHPCYGLAEATLMVTGAGGKEKYRIREIDNRFYVSCGTVIPNHDLVIEASTKHQGVGEIVVTGPSISEGYWSGSQESFFQSKRSEYPSVRTGDVGLLIDNELYVVGRSKEIIIVNGQNYALSDIDSVINDALESIEGVSEAASYRIENSPKDEFGVYLRSRREVSTLVRDKIENALNKEIFVEFGFGAAQIHIARDSIPRTSSGKIQRSILYETVAAS